MYCELSSSSDAQVLWASSNVKFEQEARGVNCAAFDVTGSITVPVTVTVVILVHFFGVKIHCEDGDGDGRPRD
jgi:hypothetical protein